MTYDIVGLNLKECIDYLYEKTEGDVLIGHGCEFESVGFTFTVYENKDMQKFMEVFLDFQKRYPAANLRNVEADVYYDLTIMVDDTPITDDSKKVDAHSGTWLSDEDGHLVSRSIGTMKVSVKPGRYKYRLHLFGEDTYFNLTEDKVIDETKQGRQSERATGQKQ